MKENEKAPAPKRIKKPNMLVRLLALAATAALILGALVLVVYRDTLNVDALKRWLAYRDMPAGEAAPFKIGRASCRERVSLAV